MRQRIFFAATVAGLLCASGASATGQSVVDPVTAAYREYKAAHDRRDLPAAEAAAKRALTASEARGGDKDVTSILAMNLATIEMDLGHKADAIAPARRALELADNGAKGVDLLTLRLMLGDAELSTVPTGDESDLLAALRAANGRADLDDYIYPAAITLTASAQVTHRYGVMFEAAQAAERHAAGANMELQLARGRAEIIQGLALVSQQLDDDADNILTHAIVLLAPLAPEVADDVETIGERSYAEALAIRGAERSRQFAEGGYKPPAHNKREDRPQLKDKSPLCDGSLRPTPYPKNPTTMMDEFSVGSAVLRASIDANGDVRSIRALAIFPESDFRQSVLDTKIKWKFVPAKPLPGCRMATTDKIQVVSFSIQ